MHAIEFSFAKIFKIIEFIQLATQVNVKLHFYYGMKAGYFDFPSVVLPNMRHWPQMKNETAWKVQKDQHCVRKHKHAITSFWTHLFERTWNIC